MNRCSKVLTQEISTILDLIRHSPDISRINISRQLGISPASTTRIISKLIQNNLVVEADEITAENAGRRATKLIVNNDVMNFAGIEISDIYIAVSIIDFGGNLLYTARIDSSPGESLKGRLTAAENLLSRTHYRFQALGISCIGTIDPERKIIDYCDILGWEKVEAGRIAEKIFNVPIYIDNDVKCDLLGEYFALKGENYNFISLLSFARGVASATMEYNCIQRGFMNVSGEIGHTIIEYSDGRMCSCGMRGCASTVLAEDNIIREAQKAAPDITSLRDIWTAFSNECMWAVRLLDRTSNYIAALARNIICMQNPQCIILRGSLFDEMPGLYDMVLEKYKFFAYYPLKKFENFKLGRLGAESSSFGAAIMAINEYCKANQLIHS